MAEHINRAISRDNVTRIRCGFIAQKNAFNVDTVVFTVDVRRLRLWLFADCLFIASIHDIGMGAFGSVHFPDSGKALLSCLLLSPSLRVILKRYRLFFRSFLRWLSLHCVQAANTLSAEKLWRALI